MAAAAASAIASEAVAFWCPTNAVPDSQAMRVARSAVPLSVISGRAPTANSGLGTLTPALRPEQTPIGLHLARTARIVGRAFSDALEAVDGSLPVWLVLLNLKIRRNANQRALAEAVGITGATLTHHLNAMELTRRRDPVNRHNHIVEITAAGETTFMRLAAAAQAFDERLRSSLTAAELAKLRTLLDQLGASVAPLSAP
jgi:MarR family transcriptional regulator, transcriptional regulator for hemolysin